MKKYKFIILSILAISICSGSNICEKYKETWEKEAINFMKMEVMRDQNKDGVSEVFAMFGVSNAEEYINSVKFNYGEAKIVKDDGETIVCKMSGITKIGSWVGPLEEVMFRLVNVRSGNPQLLLGVEIDE